MSLSQTLLGLESSWELLCRTDLPVVIYGTGNGADMVIDELCHLGVKISAVAASDGFVRHRNFRGFPVQSISAAAAQPHTVIVAIAFATSLPSVRKYILGLSECQTAVVPVVPIVGCTIFNREYITANEHTIDSTRQLFADDESRAVYDSILRFRFTGDPGLIPQSESSRTDALLGILGLNGDEDYLDLGAYRGDTVQELNDLCGGWHSVTAFEPDPKSFAKLSEYAAELDNISIYPLAAYSTAAELHLCGSGGRQSTLSDSGRAVKAASVDQVLCGKRISYVKMDVEGAESHAIDGMRRLLSEQKPRLSISAYHKTDDIFTLPQQILSINPDYRIFLRRHPYIPDWDINLYCI